jgi:hypothetical protein
MDNPEILATLGIQDTGRRRTKNKKTHNTSKKAKKMNNTVPSKKGG